MMKIGVYLRVSSRDQKQDSQRADIIRWLKAHGHDPDKAIWFEDVESGKHMNRPAIDALKKATFDGDIKTVVVWKLDRLARSMREGINTLGDWADAGVRVVSVTQQLDLSGPIGKTVAGFLFGIAEIDLANIRERQAAGIAEAKSRGVYRGRKAGTLKADPARARELKDKGMKPTEIMKALDIGSRTTLNKYLADAK
jgi:DNA invertase Pin-like site-specific DNA recombinase